VLVGYGSRVELPVVEPNVLEMGNIGDDALVI